MKLYVYHLPDLETMWAFLAKDAKSAHSIVSAEPKIRAVLVKVLSNTGDGLLFPAGEDSVITETEAS